VISRCSWDVRTLTWFSVHHPFPPEFPHATVVHGYRRKIVTALTGISGSGATCNARTRAGTSPSGWCGETCTSKRSGVWHLGVDLPRSARI
jgi:hypothetical protein